jgi:hypothetical protein
VASQARLGATWLRLIRDPARIRAILLKLARLGLGHRRRAIAGLFRTVPSEQTVSGRIAVLRRRGAALILVYCSNEPGMAEVRQHLGRTPAEIERKLGRRSEMLETADHNLSTADAQDRLRAILDGAVAKMLRAAPRWRQA